MDWKKAWGKTKEEAEDAHEKIVEGAAANPKRFVNIVIAVVLALLVLVLVSYCRQAKATGMEYAVPVIVKPVVVVAKPVASVAPAAQASAPAAQPASGGHGPGAAGWIAIGFVVSFLGKVVVTHMAWCEEDDKKPPKERRCYRPLRDGMP